MAPKAKGPVRSSKGDDASESPPSLAQQPAIDQVLRQLEQVVEALEGGDLPLEQALARFEEGVALARRGGLMLDALEERVEVLLAHRGETVAFDPNGPQRDDDSEADEDDDEQL